MRGIRKVNPGLPRQPLSLARDTLGVLKAERFLRAKDTPSAQLNGHCPGGRAGNAIHANYGALLFRGRAGVARRVIQRHKSCKALAVGVLGLKIDAVAADVKGPRGLFKLRAR